MKLLDVAVILAEGLAFYMFARRGGHPSQNLCIVRRGYHDARGRPGSHDGNCSGCCHLQSLAGCASRDAFDGDIPVAGHDLELVPFQMGDDSALFPSSDLFPSTITGQCRHNVLGNDQSPGLGALDGIAVIQICLIPDRCPGTDCDRRGLSGNSNCHSQRYAFSWLFSQVCSPLPMNDTSESDVTIIAQFQPLSN
ncbi:MAG: hypothetical protein K0S68_164 [Candidatus Saccharibacteria bacterium]|nr:hypothetical protein [Candidatus Saccharibacteria bacterium]